MVGPPALAARGFGWGYATFGAGGGYVIGKFPEYLDAAEEMGVGSLKPGKGVIDFFTQAGAWQTLNQAYLDAQMFFGRSVYLSNVPLGQEGSGFGMELEYLMAHGVGPDQWQYVSLRFMGF